MAAPKKPKPVVIQWLDICSPSTQYWSDGDEEEYGPCEITSRGYLVHKSKAFITVAQSIAADGMPGGLLSIPTACVVKIRYAG